MAVLLAFCKCGRPVNEQGSNYCCRMCNLGYGSHSKTCDRRYYNMAQAWKCDRCGRYSDKPYTGKVILASTNELAQSGAYYSLPISDTITCGEVCTDCFNEVVNTATTDPCQSNQAAEPDRPSSQPMPVLLHEGSRPWQACPNAANEHAMHLWLRPGDINSQVICPGALAQFINPLWGF